MKTKLGLLTASLLLFLNGCATSGTQRGSLSKFHACYFDDVEPLAETLQREVYYTLAHYGLQTVSPTNQPDVLRCEVETDMRSVWNYSVKITLWDGKTVVVSVQAGNHGWGTAIAHGAAVNDLYLRAVRRLETELERGGLRKQ